MKNTHFLGHYPFVLTVSVGGVTNSKQDLRNISDLFRFDDYRDE
jgi:hypothetical protein